MSSPPAPAAIASAASPAAPASPASGVEAVARQPINADRFTAAQLADAEENEALMRAGPRIVTPSNINPWRGNRRAAGEFTGEQLRKMAALELTPADQETTLVVCSVTVREMWWPERQPAPRLIWVCPILKRRPDGKLRVISAGGSETWVYADGSITKGRG
jgi:hypothetical protein